MARDMDHQPAILAMDLYGHPVQDIDPHDQVIFIDGHGRRYRAMFRDGTLEISTEDGPLVVYPKVSNVIELGNSRRYGSGIN